MALTPEQIAECQTNLTAARAALAKWASGGQVLEIRNENTVTRYAPANARELRQYIAELESQCGCSDGTGKRRRPTGVIF